MIIIQSPSFIKKAKKLHENQAEDLDKAISYLKKNPLLGELKRGDLAGIRVYKFDMCGQLTLLAYIHDTDTVHLKLFGPHENFYRSLKKLF